MKLEQMVFSVNTDTVDIERRQIGIHFKDTVNRVYCAGVNHDRTQAGVSEATRIAKMFAAAPKMLAELKLIQAEVLEHGDHGDAELASRLYRIIALVEGK